MKRLKMNKILPIFAAVSILAAACTEEEKPKVTVEPTLSSLDYLGGTVPMEVTCNYDWTASCDYEEVEIHPSSGSGNASVVVIVPESTYKETQAIRITFKSQRDTSYTSTAKHAITLAPKPFVELSTASGVISPNGGGVRIGVTSNDKWVLSCTPDIPGMEISPLSGTYNGEVSVSLPANTTGSPRSMKLRFELEKYAFATAEYTVSQGSE